MGHHIWAISKAIVSGESVPNLSPSSMIGFFSSLLLLLFHEDTIRARAHIFHSFSFNDGHCYAWNVLWEIFMTVIWLASSGGLVLHKKTNDLSKWFKNGSSLWRKSFCHKNYHQWWCMCNKEQTEFLYTAFPPWRRRWPITCHQTIIQVKPVI